MSKKTIIAGILALIIGYGIGTVIPVAANSSFKIDSIEEAKAIVEGKAADKVADKENDIQNELATNEVEENETIQNTVEADSKDKESEDHETEVAKEKPEEADVIEESENVTGNDDSVIDNENSVVEKDSSSIGDNAVTFDFNPDDIRVFGYELRPDVIEKICKDYNIPEGIESADKELDDGNILSVYQYEQEDGDKMETQISISVHNSSYTKYLMISKTEYDKPDQWNSNGISLSVGGDELINNADVANDFMGKYVEAPFIIINEDELENIFHVREIVDPLGLKNVEKVPVESNYEGTKLSEYSGDFHTVTLHIGNYDIAASRQVDKTDNYYIYAKYNY